VAVPALIFVIALGGGALVAARALPRLDSDRVGWLSFWIVCLLVGIAVALVGLNVYATVRTIDQVTANVVGTAKSDVLANGLTTILEQVGPVLGLAAAVYLLAPSGEAATERRPQ
jgi:hypothetical protein